MRVNDPGPPSLQLDRQGDLWSCACGYEKHVATDKDRLSCQHTRLGLRLFPFSVSLFSFGTLPGWLRRVTR